MLCAKLVSLEDDFPSTRRVAGDGNCFYRAALFALLEHVLAAPDPPLGESPGASPRGGPAATTTTPVGSPRGAGAGVLTAAAATAAAQAQAEAGLLPPAHDPSAYRGGQLLLRLLRSAWFKAPDADAPCDVSTLERLLNHSADSGDVIRFARSLTVRELVSAESFYEPFIPGCGRDYTGLSLRQICVRHVLPLGFEVEQLQIIALCTALGATVAVLDVAGSQVGAIKHGPEGQRGPPVAWVAHLPGHYDVIYPARPLDVAPGGGLVDV
ncbi:Ubiquitin thioesterase otubain-like [Tetrabaena socialis]|uniref:Ubiquitin thioesterase otubain-like n=1 Tax=Tetrabaena socialis TaxID=47790 RepID=A0A2J7ZJ46_9CHLO|nr:Ubiquitin thioesterase otubain-like [Tetrabaena socialis]|eukprot:PNH00287.1 Ubiquitin thioesterase otubain-like [Tetrabaena socialis]